MLQVRIREKTFHQGPTLALSGVDIQVGRGQFVAILGPSGAGKTTLLNIVAGLDRDFDGEVSVGEDFAPAAMVFQSPRLMPWLSVRDNVRLVLRGDDDAAQALQVLLSDLGLEGFEDAFPAQLSGGMQRRVGLARAFAVKPRLLLMDEPFVSLDEPLAWRLRQQLMDLWNETRPTVLYVTHDLEEALSLADRILFMSARPGHVVLDHPLDLPRPRGAGDPGVARVKAQLRRRHPQLLAGCAEKDPPSAAGQPGPGEDPSLRSRMQAS